MDGWAGYLVACTLAAAVGVAELVSRYRDRPIDLAASPAAWLYAGLNGAAAGAALVLSRIFQWDFGAQDPGTIDAARVLVSSFGSLALFRSSLFTVRAGDTDISIGPSTLLTMALNAAELGVNRHQGSRRSKCVKELLTDVDFEKAKEALPSYCFNLMEGAYEDDQKRLSEEIVELERSSMAGQIKSFNLGLSLLRITGVTVLTAATRDLKDQISIDPPPPK